MSETIYVDQEDLEYLGVVFGDPPVKSIHVGYDNLMRSWFLEVAHDEEVS